MKCLFCNSENTRKKWRKQGYDFIACRDCELIFIDPMPTEAELAKYYEEEFFSGEDVGGYLNYEVEQKWRQKNYERDVANIEQLVPSGTFFDVGCATGHFLDVMGDHWEKYGLEVSEYAGKEAQKTYGDRIQICKLQDAQFEENTFDVVTLWETINHMVDPYGDMRKIHQILKPGGIVVISVGDVASVLAKAMGKFWYHVTPPIHLYYFTPKTMQYLFDQLGFELVQNTYPGKYVDLATAFERVRDTTSSPWLTRICRRFASFKWARTIFYVNLKDTMYIYARKK